MEKGHKDNGADRPSPSKDTNDGNFSSDSPLSRKKNISTSFLVLKSQKLATALFFLTDNIALDDPIRKEIRNCAIVFLTDMIRNCAIVGPISSTRRLLLTQDIDVLSALITLLSGARLISDEVLKVLYHEFSLFRELISVSDSPRGLYEEVFPHDFFLIEETEKEVLPTKMTFSNEKPLQMLWRKKEETRKGHNNSIGHNKTYKGQERMKKMDVGNTQTRPSVGVLEDSTRRKERILNLMNIEQEYSIKDIAMAVSEVSEKTVQRELANLGLGGVLKKSGNRRWSRYQRLS